MYSLALGKRAAAPAQRMDTTMLTSPSERREAAARLTTMRSPRAIRAASIHEDGTFEGYGSVFDVLDTYGDIVRPGAYAASLARHKADGTRPKMLWQHLQEEPIGIWDEMCEDDVGLFCKGRLLLDIPRAREAHLLMKAGAIDGLSIGFQTVAAEFIVADGAGYRDMLPITSVKGGQVRAVTEIDLCEVSIVTFASNPVSQVTAVRTRSDRPASSPGVNRQRQKEADHIGRALRALARRQRLVNSIISGAADSRARR